MYTHMRTHHLCVCVGGGQVLIGNMMKVKPEKGTENKRVLCQVKHLC